MPTPQSVRHRLQTQRSAGARDRGGRQNHRFLVVGFAALAGCKSPGAIGPDDAATAVADTVHVSPSASGAFDAGYDGLPDAVAGCREAGATRFIANRSSVVLTGKLRKRVMKPAVGVDSGQWHDVFVLDLEDPPCITDGGWGAVYPTAQIDAVWQGTGPKAWYALVGHRVTVEGVADAWSSGRPHFFEPIVLDPGATLAAAK